MVLELLLQHDMLPTCLLCKGLRAIDGLEEGHSDTSSSYKR